MQNITWLLVGWNFLCWTRVEHTIRNSISTRSHVLFSIYIPYVNTEQRQFQINLALQFWAPLKFCLLGKKKPEKELDDETSWVKFKCVYHLFIPALLWATGLARIFAVTTILEIYFAILGVSIKVGGVNLMQEEQQNFVGIAFYSVIDTSLHAREFSWFFNTTQSECTLWKLTLFNRRRFFPLLQAAVFVTMWLFDFGDMKSWIYHF